MAESRGSLSSLRFDCSPSLLSSEFSQLGIHRRHLEQMNVMTLYEGAGFGEDSLGHDGTPASQRKVRIR